MRKNSIIYISGHTGLVGSAILRELRKQKYKNIFIFSHKDVNLLDNQHVNWVFKNYNPGFVFHCAAKVGGIQANINYPTNFIYENIMISTNIINACYKYGVKKLINFGSSCIFPTNCPQPMKEEYLLTGKLEPTNEYYAIAKIAAIKMCEAYNKQYGTNFLSLMLSNLYGIGDSFNLNNSHVLPALIRKFHEAKINNEKEVTLWGTGTPIREFTYIDDLAKIAIKCMEGINYSDIGEFLNVGSNEYISIYELALLIKDIIDYKGGTTWGTKELNGMACKYMDYTKFNKIIKNYKFVSLIEGLKETYNWFSENYDKGNVKL